MPLLPLTVYVTSRPSDVTELMVWLCSPPLYVRPSPSPITASAMSLRAMVNALPAVPVKFPVPVTVRVYIPASVPLLPLTVYVTSRPSDVTELMVWLCSPPLYVRLSPSSISAPAMSFRAMVNSLSAVPVKFPVPVTVRVYVPASVRFSPLTVYVTSKPSAVTEVTVWVCWLPLYVSPSPSSISASAMSFRATSISTVVWAAT